MSFRNLICLFLMALALAGCAASSNIDDKVIAVVGDKNITYGEFKHQYATNYLVGGDTSNTIESKDNFLNLLVDYRLKLLDAEAEHLQDDPGLKAELKGYEDQLAVSYVLERTVTMPAVQKIYDRQKYEVRADQVFIPFAAPAGDTLKSYDQAMDLIKEIKSGASIDSLLKKYRGGDTYFITAGSFLQYAGGEEYEDMLYSLNPGEVGPVPIRTAYGYLVVKLLEKHPRVESIRASHILVPIPGNTPDDTMKAYKEAISIMDSMKQGVEFGKLAKDNSSDRYSAEKNGDLGFFSRGMMVREFDEAAFRLKVGEVTGPVRTRFGYHIIKLTDVKQIPPFEDAKDKIRQNYLNGGYKVDLAKLESQLMTKYKYKLDEGTFNFLYGKIDTTKRFDEIDFDSVLTDSEKQNSLFSFDEFKASIDTVVGILSAGENPRTTIMNRQGLSSSVDDAAKQMLLSYYAGKVAHTYPEFDSLVNQYRSGILIYQTEQKNVWGKVSTSDSVLKPYYFDHVNKYYWPNRVDLSEIQVFGDSLANFVYDSLNHGGSFDSLAAKYTKRAGMAEKDGHWGLLADSSNALAIAAMSMKEGEFSRPIKFERGYSIIKVDKFVPSAPKTFEEARAEVSADYQEAESKVIMNDWLKNLKAKFGVQIYDKAFHDLLAQ